MALDTGVALAVLLAGALHAGWNTLVKTGGDRMATFVLVMLGAGMVWLPIAILRGPPDAASWPYLAASCGIHLFYSVFLLTAYRYGDLSQVYPIARGSAPALVAAGAWLFVGEVLSGPQALGIAVVSGGILSLAWRQRRQVVDPRGAVFALLTGVTIGGYIVADGIGVRLAGDALAYIAWVFVIQGMVLAAFGLWLRRDGLRAAWRTSWAAGLGGGVFASISYGIAVWAMSLGPMAHVTALRETSVLIAALIGTRLLGEPLGRRRVIAAAAVAAGAVVLHAGGAA